MSATGTPRSPEAPPPTETPPDTGSVPSDQDDTLRRAEAACHTPLRQAIDDIESKLSSRLLHVLEGSREVHAGLMVEAGLDGDAPEELEERSQRLLAYRRRLAGEVLSPLRLAFGGSGPNATALDALDAALGHATEAARALPARVDGTWPEDALVPHPDDALGRRVRKRLGRLVSAARKGGTERKVPLRAVALHHLGETLAPKLDSAAVDAFRDWAGWERELETVWTEWGEVALPDLIRVEQPESDAPDDGEKEDRPSLWTEIARSASDFHAALGALFESCPLDDLIGALDSALVESREVLVSDLAVAGSFVFTPQDMHRIEPTLEALTQMRPALEAWDEGVANRLQLYGSLLGILSGASAVQRRLVRTVREDQLTTASVLSEIAVELERLAEALPEEGPLSEIESRLQETQREVDRILEPTAQAIPDSAEMNRSVQSGANATVDALLAMVRQAPSSLELHPDNGRLPGPRRRPETRTVALQELARQSFDALRIERIRSSTANLVGTIDEVRADVEELPNVFAFAFDAAQKELEEGDEGAAEKALGLVTEALLSMAESLRNGERSMEAAVQRAQKRLGAEVSEGSLGLVDRVAAGRMQARLLAARSSVAELRAWLNERLGPPLERASRKLAARFKILRRWASRGLRKGTEMVGTPSATGEASARTLRRLSDAEAALADLPLVYQRLFTLQPVSDPSLLAGRDGELADGITRWMRWKESEGVPLIVQGRPGSGITSFLDVLGTKISEDGGSLGRVVLDQRVVGEDALARMLSAKLGLNAVDSLDDLATAIFDAPRGGLPDAVSLDNMEHLYLRVPNGTDLIERLLTLMAETEPRIFWIGGITSSAWQLVSVAEPTAVSQVEVLELEQLTGAELREAMITRHRRSGLPLRFKEPESRRRLLRQRLKRLRDPEAYDDLLASDFFDRLERASSHHVRLALFQWLMAADFGQADGVVMEPPERPDFTILDALTLTQNFTLKAFLEHRTLTLAEHDRIFRLPRHESYQIFESLQNRRLIESVTTDGNQHPERSEIQEDLRYRVRPLVVGAVLTHLRGRNIVH